MDPCDIPIPAIQAGCVAVGTTDSIVTSAASSALDSIGEAFARGAETVLSATFEAIAATSTVDLGAAFVSRNASALASVALVLIVGLFIVQAATAAIRQEPGGLVRALTGAGFAVLGTAVAATVVQALLVVVDQISAGIASLAGTSIEEAARQLLDVALLLQLAGTPAGSALMVLFGLFYIVGAVLTLGTLLVRNALLIVAVVVAPLAFAGGAARITSTWVRRWIQVTLALILSKLAIVLVFVIAVGLVGDATGIGAVLSGLILLLLACLAPWACFKILDFAGTNVASEWHRGTNGATVAAVNQGRVTATSILRTAAPVLGGGAGAAAAAGATASSGQATPPPPAPPLNPPMLTPPAPVSGPARQDASSGGAT
jgi:type IV secretion system protein TrbL